MNLNLRVASLVNSNRTPFRIPLVQWLNGMVPLYYLLYNVAKESGAWDALDAGHGVHLRRSQNMLFHWFDLLAYMWVLPPMLGVGVTLTN